MFDSANDEPVVLQGADTDSITDDGLISHIVLTNRMRNQLLEANRKLTLQSKAVHRLIQKNEFYAGHAEELAEQVCLPLAAAQAPIEDQKKLKEKALFRAVQKLPVYDWWISHKGLGYIGLAQIVGEAGDLSRFHSVGALWKRFGLHVEAGAAPRPKAGRKLDYSPRRRAVMHVIGDAFIRTKGEYRTLYDERKAYEIAKLPDAPAWVSHKRALRYAEKRLLRNLYNAWKTHS